MQLMDLLLTAYGTPSRKYDWLNRPRALKNTRIKWVHRDYGAMLDMLMADATTQHVQERYDQVIERRGLDGRNTDIPASTIVRFQMAVRHRLDREYQRLKPEMLSKAA